ncbi:MULTISPECIES: phage tail protein [Enterobacterales]|uniref:Phage tail fibre protein N-terminal domain-containing protein n=1 Tax=Serratia plymuthica S13 TaxID=1348660 RepID=S4YR67_SERPL|nr:phage tail protein [Serratia plymuthica]AGP46800.1 hypothetical protein M621_03970 [Serratia plymuthica S13]ANJ92762.1 hypothetical protein ADP72_07110 [Serratia plymuthica]ANJ97172.1 hypothetical protein ADP73_04130 [Serratia plymuthica]EKF66204.1 putative tail fiber protein [Serratia plymuthica A30]KYG17694.1 Phage tail fiber repeat protein [Serratia plymuthica]
MGTKYFCLLTNKGASKLASTVEGTKKIKITQMAVGDGGGFLPAPSPSATSLINENYRASLNSLTIIAGEENQLSAELLISESIGGWWIRELGLYDDEGDLIAIGNCPETYKPKMVEGSGRRQNIRMILAVSSIEKINLITDPSIIVATRDYVDDLHLVVLEKLSNHEKSRNHPDATLQAKGLVQLSNDSNSSSETLAATPKALKSVNDAAVKKTGDTISGGLTVNGTIETKSGLTTSSLSVNGSTTITGGLTAKASVELYGSTPYIDFHYNNNNGDFDTRLINDNKGVLSFHGSEYYVNGKLSATGDIWFGGKVNIDGTSSFYGGDFITKSGNITLADGNRQTNGLRLQGMGNLFTDIYHYEKFGNYHEFGIHVANGGADGWFTFRNNGEFHANGAIFASGAVLQTDGNLNGSVWGGYLNNYLDRNYVRDIRLASRGTIITDGNMTEAPSGAVITGGNGNEGNDVGYMYYRMLQKYINNNWYTVAYV